MNFTRLDNFLDKLTSWRIPGCDVIIMKDGEVIHRYFSGYSNLEDKIKMNGSESYNMYSSSKPVTVAAALTLVEKGDILLTDNLSEYIPEYKNVMVEIKDEDGNVTYEKPCREITVRDIFTMTSGFDYTLETEAIKEIRENSIWRVPTVSAVRAFAKNPLVAHPGDRWIYGINHDILAGLCEIVTGERFSAFVKRVIFDVLGMENSDFSGESESLRARMARQYTFDYKLDRPVFKNNGNKFILGIGYESGGAGLISTVEDYIKFAYAMANGGVGANGGRILSPCTIELMRTNALTEAQRRSMNCGQYKGYGYGLGVRTMIDTSEAGSLGPVGEFGWAGAAGSYVMIDPDNNLALFYTHHMLENQEEYVVNRIRNITYACLQDR